MIIDSNIIIYSTFLRQHQKFSLGDSIIAATAIYYKEELLTNNIKDFVNFPNIKLISLNDVKG